MTKYAFEVKTLVVVDADSLEDAWEQLPMVAKAVVGDFDYEYSEEDSEEE